MFLAAGLLLGLSISSTRPALRDPDSTLYAAMSSQLSAQAFSSWMTPRWPEGRMKTGRFVEHTAVSLWPGALLERVGLPAGALVANVLCAVVLLWLVGRLTALLAPGAEALGWAAWGLGIIGVQYWLRANHEIWWATASLAALLAVAARWPRWLVVAFTVAGCSIKGPLGLDTVLLVAPLAWVVHGRRWLWWYGLFTAIAVLAFAALYEVLFQRVTGTSFVSAYFSTQVGYVLDSETSAWLTKPRNLIVYLGKLIWFSLPGALLLGWARWKKRTLTRETMALLLGLVLVVVATSLMSRQAGRYIFPCYAVLAVIGAASAASSRLGGFLHTRGRAVITVVFLVALGRVLLASAVYSEVNLLPGTRVMSGRRH